MSTIMKNKWKDLASVLVALILYAWLALILNSCSRTESKEDKNEQRNLHVTKQGWKQAINPLSGEVNTLEYGETTTEQETTLTTTQIVITKEVVPPKFLDKAFQAFGSLGQLTSGGGIVAAVLGLVGTMYQRRKRKVAEVERDEERQTSEEVAELEPEKARERLKEKRGHHATK